MLSLLAVRRLFKTYGFGVGLALLYLYSFPYFAKIHHANELPRVYLTMSMVDDHTFAIDTGVKRWGSTPDVSPSGGHHYSNKAPGASMLAAPAYAVDRGLRALFGLSRPSLAETTWLCRVVTGVIPALLFLLLFYRFLARFAPRPETRRLVIAAYALGSMAMPYSILYHSHQLSAVLIATAFILAVWVMEDGADERWMWAAGLAAGAAPLTDYQAAFAGVPIAIYVIVRALKRPRGWRPILYAAIGAIPPIALLLYYHWAAFGSPFRTGYSASETFAFYHQKGFLGMDKFRLEALSGSTIAADHGLLFFCPLLLSAVVGWVILARRRLRWATRVTLSIAVIYVAFQSSINFWRAGWSLGPRYITVMLPFVFIPVAVALDAAEGARLRTFWRGLWVGLALVGIVVYAVSSALYPHFPERFSNPLYEVTFRLLMQGRAPYNLGWVVGLRGFASLLPYLLVLAAVVAYAVAPARRDIATAAGGAALAAIILGFYSLAPRAETPDTIRAYTCYVAGVMPDRPPVGTEGGSCGPGRSCDEGLSCLSCDPAQHLCIRPPGSRL